LGTIMLGPHPFADRVKCRPEVRTVLVSGVNHNVVLKQILAWLQAA
jgi:hypothetical protein